ncbi:hypothetical protein O181_068136 [Austropuccinia psidii MF-1]|uniref:Uncharacterized protein n=1 Tax=Austropuccinia psidii MF-1 TaxID=1389203 RepID=A0A9Q3EU92_9BASI|nr:hypothetical protein [Austropuccinia psidii MF-1]
MGDARAPTSSQTLSSTFDTIFESTEAEITTIPAFRSEKLPTGSSRNIPVSVQELVYGRKETGVGTSAQLLYRENELLPSSEGVLGPRKDTRTSEVVESHVLQGTGPKDKIFGKPKNSVRGSEEIVGPKEGKEP